MRTAVVRVDVDPSAKLAPAQLADGMTMLSELAAAAGVEAVDADLAAMPAKRRQVELLIAGDDPYELTRWRSTCAARPSGRHRSPGW